MRSSSETYQGRFHHTPLWSHILKVVWPPVFPITWNDFLMLNLEQKQGWWFCPVKIHPESSKGFGLIIHWKLMSFNSHRIFLWRFFNLQIWEANSFFLNNLNPPKSWKEDISNPKKFPPPVGSPLGHPWRPASWNHRERTWIVTVARRHLSAWIVLADSSFQKWMRMSSVYPPPPRMPSSQMKVSLGWNFLILKMDGIILVVTSNRILRGG